MGRALSFDLEIYIAARSQALVLLSSSLRGGEHTELFKMTESFRPGAEGREKIDNLISTLYSLLEDLMFIESGTPQLVRNTDIAGELKKLAESADFAWINRAAQGLDLRSGGPGGGFVITEGPAITQGTEHRGERLVRHLDEAASPVLVGDRHPMRLRPAGEFCPSCHRTSLPPALKRF